MNLVKCVISRKSEQRQARVTRTKQINKSLTCNLSFCSYLFCTLKPSKKWTIAKRSLVEKQLIQVVGRNLLTTFWIHTQVLVSPSTNNLQPFQGIKPQMPCNNPSVTFCHKVSKNNCVKSQDDDQLAFEMKDNNERKPSIQLCVICARVWSKKKSLNHKTVLLFWQLKKQILYLWELLGSFPEKKHTYTQRERKNIQTGRTDLTECFSCWSTVSPPPAALEESAAISTSQRHSSFTTGPWTGP